VSMEQRLILGFAPDYDHLMVIGKVEVCNFSSSFHQGGKEHPCERGAALILGFAPDYDHLMVIGKVEVFEHALTNTPGNDLARVLWLKSRSAGGVAGAAHQLHEDLAVMSMVGYVLGLGDRHPSNLMLDRFSGKIIHIDFGDCFEASMHREKFPEKFPFSADADAGEGDGGERD